MSNAVCIACSHAIDAAARICPYCGANPVTGEKVDTQALLQEVFQSRELTTSESILEYARHRQGIVVAFAAIAGFLLLAGLHQFVTVRNNRAVTDSPAVPLTEVADLSGQSTRSTQLPMPPIEFEFNGQSSRMRTFIVEPGAVAPPSPPATATAPGVAQGAPPVPPAAGPRAVPGTPGVRPQPAPAPTQTRR